MADPIIRSLELTNFMCHTRFSITFDKLITCVSGSNGSGKSALMVALGVLFGQRAQSLERGSSFKELIKTGSNQAIIKVVLNNRLGYKKDIYSQSIIVEKHIRPHSCKLSIGKVDEKSRNLKMCSASGAELKLIIEKYRLRFENPLNFMTQELSKRFLSSATPKHLYDFFYRGTEFKNINEELNESFSRLEEMRERLEKTIAQHGSVCSMLEIHRRNLDFLSVNFESILEKLSFEEALWNVSERLRQRDSIYDAAERIISQSQELDKRIGELHSAVSGAKYEDEKSKEARLTELWETSNESIKRLQQVVSELETDYEEYKEELEKRTKSLRLAEMKGEIDKLTLAHGTAAERKKVEEKVLEESERREQELLNKIQLADKEREEISKKKYALRKQADYLRSNATDQTTEATLRSFKVIKEEIEKCDFSDEVIGPICEYIELKDYKWYKAVSTILKRSITTYIVFNKGDKIKLLDIFRKYKYSYTISLLSSKRIISNYSKPYFGPSTPPTLLDVLRLKKDIVLNYLIMMHNAEQILMIEDREEAYKIVRANHQGVECAYTPAGDKIKLVKNFLSDFKARDDGRYWFEDKHSRLKKLERAIEEMTKRENGERESLSEQLSSVRTEIARKKESVARLSADLRALEKSLEALKSENSTLEYQEQRCKQLERSIGVLEKKLEESRNELRVKEEENVALRRDLESKKAEVEKAVERAKAELKSIQLKKFSLEGSLVEQKRSLAAAEEKLTEAVERARGACPDSFSLLECGLDMGSIRVEGIVRDVRADENSLNTTTFLHTSTGDHGMVKHDKNTLTCNPNEWGPSQSAKRLKKVCEPVLKAAYLLKKCELPEELYAGLRDIAPYFRKPKEIALDKVSVNEQLLRARELPSKEATEELVAKLSKEAEKCEYIRDQYEDLILSTITACEKRIERREEIKDKKTKEAIELFRQYTRRRGYEGDLVFDHENHLLDMKVKVHGNKDGGARETLSGGERSFASVCLLVSLWQSFLCPVKVLDEFDVFMDPVNRSCAVKLIFEVLRKCEVQGILITPLSMSDFANQECDIKMVEKMND